MSEYKQHIMIVTSLFLKFGLISPKAESSELENRYYQPFVNILFFILSVYTAIVPFFFKTFYFNDNKIILCAYIIIVYSVYANCVSYFQQQNKIEYLDFETEASKEQLCKLRTNYFVFCAMAFYLTVGVPTSTILSTENISSFQLISSIVAGIYWGMFTMVCSCFYLYINIYCMGMTVIIKHWLKSLKRLEVNSELYLIYQVYNKYYKLGKGFRKRWNNILCITFMIITFRIPFSFILVFYNEIYWEIPLLVFHIYNWIFLVIPICELNEQNDTFVKYFYKHPHILLNKEDINEIINYNHIKPLGINIFGFMPKYSHLLSIVFIFSNVLVPLFIGFLTDTLKKK